MVSQGKNNYSFNRGGNLQSSPVLLKKKKKQSPPFLNYNHASPDLKKQQTQFRQSTHMSTKLKNSPPTATQSVPVAVI